MATKLHTITTEPDVVLVKRERFIKSSPAVFNVEQEEVDASIIPSKAGLKASQDLTLSKIKKDVKESDTFDNFNSNSWNSELEILLKSIGEQSNGIRWMHNADASMYSLIDTIVGLISIMFTVLNAFVVGILSAGYSYWYVILIGAIIAALCLLMTLIKQFAPFDDWVDDHEQAEGGYLQFGNIVKLQLAFNRRDRDNGKIFIETMHREFNNLFTTSPKISLLTKIRFKKMNKLIKIVNPNDIEGPIIINTGSNEVGKQDTLTKTTQEEISIVGVKDSDKVDKNSGKGDILKINRNDIFSFDTHNCRKSESDLTTVIDREDKKNRYELNRYLSTSYY